MHKFLQNEHIYKLTGNDHITATTPVVICDRFRFDESGSRGGVLHCSDSDGGAGGGSEWGRCFPPTVVDEPSTTIQDPTEIWVGKLADSGPLCGENHVARFAGNLIRKHPIRESAAENHSFPGLWRDTNLSLNTDSEIYVEEPCSQQLSPQVSPFMGFDSPDSSHSRMEWPDTPSIRRTPVGSRDGMDFEKVTKHGSSMMEETTVTTDWGTSNAHSSPSSSTWYSSPEVVPPNCDSGGSDPDRRCSLYNSSPTSCSMSMNALTAPAPALATTRKLSCDGFRVIVVNIIEPLLGNHLLVEFHKELRLVIRRMQKGSIPTLRDLEKVLLFDRGPATAITATSYLRLCCEFLERSRNVVHLLQLPDLLPSCPSSAKPTDGKDDKDRHLHPPYEPKYFLDAWLNARATAQIKFHLGRSELERTIKNMRSQQEPLSPPSDDNLDANVISSFFSAWGRLKMGPRTTPCTAVTSTLKRQLLGSANSVSSCEKNPVVDGGGDLAIVNLQPSSASLSEEIREQSATAKADQQQPFMFSKPPIQGIIMNKVRCSFDPQTMTTTTTTVNSNPSIQNNTLHHYHSPILNNAPSTYSRHSFKDSTSAAISPSKSTDTDYPQSKRLRTSAVVPSAPVCGASRPNPKQSSLAPPSPPESTSTSVQSDGSTSPSLGGGYAARKMKTGGMKLYVCGMCNKEFPRACDLTKHRKTHDRPYKCSEASCRYASTGFSAEKDRDRHYQDKHDKNAPRIECHWKCGYMSPRESNVKQHMEKAHGYHYVRTKSVHKPKPPDNRPLKRKPPTPGRQIASASLSLASPQNSHQIQQSKRGREYISSEPLSSPERFGLSTPSPQIIVEANDISPASTEQSSTIPPCHNNLPFFPPLKGPTTSQSISPAFIQTSEPYHTAQYPSLFQSPSGAVQAMNDQKGNCRNSSSNNTDINDKERCQHDENAGSGTTSLGGSRNSCIWHNVNDNTMNAPVGAMNPNSQIDPLLVGEDGDVDLMSPEFVDTFLVDAPEDILERVEHDTRLPIVHNYVYDEDRERVLTC